MLKLIFAPAGTAPAPFSQRPSLLLVPDQFSFEAERDCWLALGPEKAPEVQVFGFERLSDEVFRLYGGLAGNFADDTLKLLLMREALRAVRPALKLYGKLSARPDFVQQMLAAAEEFKRAAITPGALAEEAGTAASDSLREKLADLSLICESYDALLARSFYDPSNNLERAAALIEKNCYFTGKTVYVDQFKSFTARQLQILGLAMAQANEVTVALCLDADGSPLFDGVQETKRRLLRLAAEKGCKVLPPVQLTEPSRYAAPELAHFSRQLLRPAPRAYAGENKAVQCTALNSLYDEAGYVAASIAGLVREGYRYEDIAVVGRDMDARAPALQAAFDRYGIPWFFDGGDTADTMPLIRFVRRYCAMAAGNLPREEVLAFFKCGLLGLSAEEIAAFEDYLYVWRVSGEGMRQPFAHNPSGFSARPMELKEQQKLADAEKLRGLAVEAADRLREEISRKSLPEGVWAALCALQVPELQAARLAACIERGDETAAENERLTWEVLTGFLDAARTLSALRQREGEDDFTLREFRELLGLAAASARLAARPQTLDSVLLGSAERVRIGEKKVLFAVGAEDQVFPLTPGPGGIFTDRERKALQQDGLTLQGTIAERLADERFVAYQTLTAPSERLFISYAAGDLAGRLQAPSVLVANFTSIFPDTPIRRQQDLDPIFLCQSPSTLFLQYARCRGSEQGTLAASLRAVLEADPLYRERVARLDDAERQGRLALTDETLCRRIFCKTPPPKKCGGLVPARPQAGTRLRVVSKPPENRTMRLSPSQVEKFYSCPFAYFCRYGLGLRPRRRADLNPLSRGSVIHYLLERLLRRQDFVTMEKDRLRWHTERLLAEYLLSVMGGEDKPARFLYYYNRLLTTMLGILEALQDEFSASAFEVAGLEEAIAQGGVVEPLLLEAEKAQVQLGGKVDRVDWATLDGQTYVRVVDYKSGRKSFDKEEVSQGLNLQMLLYLFAIWQSSSGKYQDIRPAGVLYMPVRPPVPDAGRGEEGEKTYRMSGLLLNDERVLRAMEPSLEGRFLPVKAGVKGLTGKKYLETSEGFSALKKEAERLVTRMADELMSGRIAPDPQKSGQFDPCPSCDFRAACGGSTGDTRDTARQAEPALE